MIYVRLAESLHLFSLIFIIVYLRLSEEQAGYGGGVSVAILKV